MIIPTHLMLAHKLFKQLPIEHKEKLSYHLFLYGSIKPDIDATAYPYEHVLEKSLHFISKLFFELKNKAIDSPEFAIDFGVITHYISDYFCLYHANHELRKKPLSEHIKYEFELHKTLKSKTGSKYHLWS